MQLLLLLAACSTTGLIENKNWPRHQESVSALQQWQLSGRLNIRQERQSDTVNLDWDQTDDNFAIHISGTLGLGAVYIYGNRDSATLEKSGAEPVLLPGLDALGREYLDYDFPAAYLLYWVRGLPVPTLTGSSTLDQNQLLSTLEQRAPDGQRWNLEFDRYQSVDTLALPGRIRLRSQGIQLTFLISRWSLAQDAR